MCLIKIVNNWPIPNKKVKKSNKFVIYREVALKELQTKVEIPVCILLLIFKYVLEKYYEAVALKLRNRVLLTVIFLPNISLVGVQL